MDFQILALGLAALLFAALLARKAPGKHIERHQPQRMELVRFPNVAWIQAPCPVRVTFELGCLRAHDAGWSETYVEGVPLASPREDVQALFRSSAALSAFVQESFSLPGSPVKAMLFSPAGVFVQLGYVDWKDRTAARRVAAVRAHLSERLPRVFHTLNSLQASAAKGARS